MIGQIRAQHPHAPVRTLCRLLRVNRSAYLRHLRSAAAAPDTRLRDKVEEVYLKQYRSLEEARDNIGRFIEAVYNSEASAFGTGVFVPCRVRGAPYQSKDTTGKLLTLKLVS